MSTIAVTAGSSALGRALIERLDADDRVSTILCVDTEPPPMPVAKLEMRTADLRDAVLRNALAGADAVVHLGVSDEPSRAPSTAFTAAVHGTRNLLAACEAVGVKAFVHRSSSLAYGAHPDNPVPIPETARLRANPDFAPAHQHLLAEELVADFAARNPSVRTAVLRCATTLGPGCDSWWVRWMQAPRLAAVAAHRPPVQFLHVDDAAAALHLATLGELSGPANVAAEGWLAHDELARLIGLKAIEVPEVPAGTAVRRLWAGGAWPYPPGALHALMHPTVLRCDVLHEHGWRATRSNRDVVKEVVAEHGGHIALGPWRPRRRDLYLAGFAVAGAIVGMAIGRRRTR